MGFSSASLMTVINAEQPSLLECVSESSTILEFDRALQVAKFEGPFFEPEDPVLTWIRGSCLPILWRESTYLDAGLAEFHDELKKADAGNGIALSLELALPTPFESARMVLILDRRASIRTAEENRLIGDVAHLALYAADAAKRVLYKDLQGARKRRSPLTPAMMAYLGFAARGLSVKETAKALGRSPSTVNNVLQEALYRLETSTKSEAIQKCKANGWLDFYSAMR